MCRGNPRIEGDEIMEATSALAIAVLIFCFGLVVGYFAGVADGRKV
jgi:hypothetical protein